MSPSATPATQSAAQPSATSAMPAAQIVGGCQQIPRLPRETKIDVTKCHACATPATKNENSLPRETKVDID